MYLMNWFEQFLLNGLTRLGYAELVRLGFLAALCVDSLWDDEGVSLGLVHV